MASRGKRGADNYLTQDSSRDDNDNDNDTNNGSSTDNDLKESSTGAFSRASDDVLKKRVILGPKRRSGATPTSTGSVAAV